MNIGLIAAVVGGGVKLAKKIAGKKEDDMSGIDKVAGLVGDAAGIVKTVQASRTGRIDAVGAKKVVKGAAIATGGNAAGAALFALLLEWHVLPETILGKPTSVAILVAALGVIAAVALNFVRKWTAHYPEIQTQLPKGQ